MIITYLRERLAWISLFLILPALLIGLAYLDPAIPMRAVLYVVLIFALIFIPFVIFRYFREVKYFQGLSELEKSLDASVLPKADRPFEKIIDESLSEQLTYLKRQVSSFRSDVDQEKDDLLSWIHEIKTPLAAMQLIIDRAENAELKQDLTYEWMRIYKLLDDQLHQKRITFIENDLFFEKVDFGTLLSQEIRSLRTICFQKGIGFELELGEEAVLSDAKWLAFILRQLLSNAVKYSNAADIIVKSFVREERTVLQVTDFGVGIEPRDVPRIFEKGFTSTGQHDKAATGMGLYLTRQAADSLGINIAVQSEVGKGTSFTLMFAKRNEMNRVLGM